MGAAQTSITFSSTLVDALFVDDQGDKYVGQISVSASADSAPVTVGAQTVNFSCESYAAGSGVITTLSGSGTDALGNTITASLDATQNNYYVRVSCHSFISIHLLVSINGRPILRIWVYIWLPFLSSQPPATIVAASGSGPWVVENVVP